MLKHCGRCKMTTSWTDDKCNRCKFHIEHGLRQPMPDEVKAHLHALTDYRKGKRATDPRQEKAA